MWQKAKFAHKSMTSRSARFLLASLFALTFSITNAFGQGSKMKSPYDPIEEKDQDNPARRAEWNQRGRIGPPGQSAAVLRLRALQQKMALRAQREAAAAKAGAAGANAPASTSWVGLGPAPLVSDSNFFGMVSGRSTSVAIDQSDPTGNTVYVGGAYGGVWKSTNAANGVAGNVTWTPVTDQQASLATGAVSVKPSGGVVLVGTGEPNNAIDSYYGVGILRSIDGGANWSLIPSGDGGVHSFVGSGFTKFAWSTAQTSRVVGSQAQAFRGVDEGKINGNTTNGLYLSTDSGQTWAYQSPTDGSNPISATDVVYNATAGKFFAAIRYHGVYSSTDGTSWTRLTTQPSAVLTLTNCPTAATSSCPMYRGQLAVVPGRNEMYFWFVDVNDNDQGIYRSTNGGGAWTKIDETGIAVCGDGFGCGTQQAFYNLEISAVADGTATDLYAGAVNLFKCKLASGATTCSILDASQGAKWINLTHVYGCPGIASVHPDEHGLDFAVVGGKAVMYFANDGGIYRALDGFTGLVSGTCGKTNAFDDLNATIGSMTQFVSFSIHPTDQNTVLGGTQDNGSPATTTATSSSQWTTANGGDGGFNAINPTTPTQWFSANTDVSIQVCNSAPSCTSGTFNLVVTNSTVGGDGGPFYTPYILDPQNSGEMLVGTCRIWRGTTGGASFIALSPNFDTGATGNAGTCTGGEINQVHSLAAGGPLQGGLSNVVYATTEGFGPFFNIGGGEVWVTTNAASTLMSMVTGLINPQTYPISSVAIDNSDASGKTAYVGIMGFGVSHVFKTTDAGGTGQPSDWTDWTGTGLPDAPVNALLVDAQAGQLYAGTDVGIFVTSTSNPTWTEVGPAPGSGQAGYLPNVPVSAIRLFNSGGTKKLRLSTYGRGIWEFNLAVAPDYTNVISDSPQTVFPTQSATFHGTLTALNGYNSPVNLTCTGTPPTTCTPTTPKTPTPGGTPYTVTASGAIGDYNFNAHAVGTDANTVTHDAAVTLHVVDFRLTDPSPSTVTAQQGGISTSTSFQVTAAGSFGGTVALTCTGPVITAGASCNFLPSANVNPTSVNPVNASVTVTVPGSIAVNNYTVTINANTAGAPAAKTKNFMLTVTAPPNFTWTGGGSHTVLAGQTTLAYDFTATPSGGPTFTTAVTFACSNLPDSTVTCAFNPAQINAGAGATGVSLTITTAGPNQGTGTSRTRRADGRTPWLPLTWPLAGIVLAGIAGRRMSRHSALAGICVSLALLGLLVACGGSSNSGPPPPVSVTVTPTTTVNLYANETGNQWPANLTQQKFNATVNNSSNQTVTWAVTGGAANGTVDNTGLYTSPPTVPNPANITVTATAAAGGTPGTGKVSILTPTVLGTFPNITVTATEGVVAHSQNVTLTVN